MMNHDDILERLDAWLDGALPRAEHEAVDVHLRGCDVCRDEAEAARWLREEARALPREIQPPRDLWAGIEARIDAKRVIAFPKAPAAPAERPAQRPWWLRAPMLAAAAVVLMLCSSVATALLLRQPGGAPVAMPAAGTEAAPAYTALAAFEPAEVEFQRAIDDLAAVLEAGRDVLDPATIEVIETNLRIIDQAIAESRAALERDPNNRELANLLSAIYHRKVDLLKDAVLLQSQT
jgi:anti-sigma factor RsiW